jgi:hypothetical protein
MACPDDGNLTEPWQVPIDLQEAVACPYTTGVGPLLAFGMVLIAVNTALYIRQERALLPIVTTLLSGGAWLELGPASLTNATQAGLLILLGVLPVLLLRRLEVV